MRNKILFCVARSQIVLKRLALGLAPRVTTSSSDEASRLLFTPRDTRNVILMILIVGGIIAVYVNS